MRPSYRVFRTKSFHRLYAPVCGEQRGKQLAVSDVLLDQLSAALAGELVRGPAGTAASCNMHALGLTHACRLAVASVRALLRQVLC